MGTILHCFKEAVLARKMTFFFYLAVFLFGILFYVIWSAKYGTWADIGVYSVTVISAGFGLLGMLLYYPKKTEAVE